MQDEVNEKTVSLCINGGKISARILKAAIAKVLTEMEQQQWREQQKSGVTYHGKQSMEKLMKQNCQLSNLEVTEGNIKSFERYARKYHVDFSLKKDTSVSPLRYFVFFKARDVDVMTAAFKEYSGKEWNKSKRPSIRKKLELAKEYVAKHREHERIKDKERGPQL